MKFTGKSGDRLLRALYPLRTSGGVSAEVVGPSGRSHHAGPIFPRSGQGTTRRDIIAGTAGTRNTTRPDGHFMACIPYHTSNHSHRRLNHPYQLHWLLRLSLGPDQPPSMKRRILSAALTANFAPAPRLVPGGAAWRLLSSSAARRESTGCREGSDPRDLGRRILDDFAYLKEQYCKPVLTCVPSPAHSLPFVFSPQLIPFLRHPSTLLFKHQQPQKANSTKHPPATP